MNQRGFTFIELLVAVLLMAVALTGLLLCFSHGLSMARHSEDAGVAYSIARQEIERVRNIGFLKLPPYYGDVDGHVTGYEYIDVDTTANDVKHDYSWSESNAADPYFQATVIADEGKSLSEITTSNNRTIKVIVTVATREQRDPKDRTMRRVLLITESSLTRGGI